VADPQVDDKQKPGDGQHQQNRRANLAADYGWSLAFFNHNPELKSLFDEAVKHSWSPTRFIAELRDTKWFKNSSATMRQYLVNKSTDPASWQQDLDSMKAHIEKTYGQMFGVAVDPDQLDRWAKHAMMFGWTDEQVADHIVSSVNVRKLYAQKSLGGTAAQVKDQIGQLAAAYGVNVGDKWAANQLQSILNGNDTIDGSANYLKELAKSKYTAFADQIDGGKTVAQIADPYVQSMASLLERSPEAIGLDNRYIQQALTRREKDKKGSHPAPMTIGEFEDSIRKTDQWMNTDQAKQQFADTAHGLLTTWGLI
jgi:hypothetical protein